jgi:hypothetical protein
MTRSRSECRSGHRCDIQSLSDAVHCVIHHSDLSLNEIAERLGVRPGYLSDAANQDRDEVQFQARLIVPLTAVTGRSTVLEYVAHSAGFAMTPIPAVALRQHSAMDDLDVAVQDLGQTAAQVRSALADGVVGADEAARVRACTLKVITAAARIADTVEAQVETAPERPPVRFGAGRRS